MKVDVAIIGGGPAGIASAISASKEGAKVALIEREYRLGGILNQCIHNGFGLHYFGAELTGPEYARKFAEMLDKCKKVKVKCNSSVTDITKNSDGNFEIKIVSPDGLQYLTAKSVVLTMGCRERPAGAIDLGGNRVAGIFSAGAAQAIVNLQGKMIGKNVVIQGSGDIGLIMARRLTCEGANVLGVYEIMPNCGGLARNVTQCLLDFNIPLHLSTTITKVIGKKRVQGVMVAPVTNGKPDYSQEKLVKCDTLLLSVGLIPEVELVDKFNLEKLRATNSFAVDEHLQTSEDGLFVAGNVLHVNDLVDNVSHEGEHAGTSAALYALGKLTRGKPIEIKHDEHIKYTAPKYFYNDKHGELSIAFRVDKEYRRVAIYALSDGEVISKRPAPVLTAGEMQTLKIDKSKIKEGLTLSIDPQ